MNDKPSMSEAMRGQSDSDVPSSVGENRLDRLDRARSKGLYCIAKRMDIFERRPVCDRFATEFTIYRHITIQEPSKCHGSLRSERKEIPRHCSICVFSVNKKEYQRLYGSLDDD